jgi:deazaflavin-dependent oxidoreductase (nitroreductase family)
MSDLDSRTNLSATTSRQDTNKQQRREFNRRNIAEFRASGGRIASFGDAPVLLLTTRGVKSGLPRTNPMMYLADEHNPERVYVFASAAGADENPAWFNDLLAHPNDLVVEIGTERVTATADVLEEPHRSANYEVQAARYPGFAAYRTNTSRQIPVITLTLSTKPRPKSRQFT